MKRRLFNKRFPAFVISLARTPQRLVRFREWNNLADFDILVQQLAVFVLAGSLDERPFHLRALAALAGIVQDTEFETHWLAARDSASLRDILLLGKWGIGIFF